MDASGNASRPLFSRARDGVWTSESGSRYSRVSAVLLVTLRSPWDMAQAPIRLYHNPWASKLYTSVLTRLPQVVLEGDFFVTRKGETLGAILGLPPK